MRNWKRSLYTLLLGSLAVTSILSGCSSNGSSEKAGKEAGGSGKPIELNITLMTESQNDTTEKESWESIAKSYMDMNPGVKINMEIQNFGGVEQHRTWVTTQLIAEMAPDIFMTRRIWDHEDLNKGQLIDLTPYFKESSAYLNNQSLEQTISPSVLAQLVGAKGQYASVPTFVDVVRVLYNQELFTKAGIEKVPQTWNEFMDAQAKLQKLGVTPFAFPNSKPGDFNYSWTSRILTEELISSTYPDLDASGNGFIELNEYVRGVDMGLIDIEKSPYRDMFNFVKDWSQYWPKGYNGLDLNSSNDMFLRGEAAMIMRTSAQSKVLFESNARQFEMSTFPLPYLTSDNHPAADGKLMEIGGVPAGNLAIPANIPEEKLSAAVDFLRFTVSPQIQGLMAEKLYRAPVTDNADLPEKLAGFKFTGEQMKLNIYGGEVDKNVTENNQKLGQLYLEGKITLDVYLSDLKKVMLEGVSRMMRENNWNKDNNYGIAP
jgi:raffinose/stachyose/melibiose transport system substrate-binding protein